MIIYLQDKGTPMTAAIDTCGAQLISLKDKTGKEFIWQRDPEIWSRCSPLLFPAVGNCRNNRTRFDGVWYEMEKHGFCKVSEFALTDQTDTTAVLKLSSSAFTRRFYPYDFVLSLTYSLAGGVLSMSYTVENPQAADICYCIGAHPGFVCPMEEGARFEDYILEFEKEEHTHAMPYDERNLEFDAQGEGISLDHTRVLPLSYELFKKDAIYFDAIRSRSVSLIHKDSRKGVELSYPGFETIAFWTPYGKNAPFLCIEPWNGSAIRSDEDDDFIHRHHLQILKPGEKKQYFMEIRLIG
ncbi:MAG: aldose 1-epimerase family protein [Lachnospiraceae bacterium]|jgi:galactose mutarotase-like enzyme|nr:aldose 1-epimerase family protein [Lachnospiraceae bacterium]